MSPFHIQALLQQLGYLDDDELESIRQRVVEIQNTRSSKRLAGTDLSPLEQRSLLPFNRDQTNGVHRSKHGPHLFNALERIGNLNEFQWESGSNQLLYPVSSGSAGVNLRSPVTVPLCEFDSPAREYDEVVIRTDNRNIQGLSVDSNPLFDTSIFKDDSSPLQQLSGFGTQFVVTIGCPLDSCYATPQVEEIKSQSSGTESSSQLSGCTDQQSDPDLACKEDRPYEHPTGGCGGQPEALLDAPCHPTTTESCDNGTFVGTYRESNIAHRFSSHSADPWEFTVNNLFALPVQSATTEQLQPSEPGTGFGTHSLLIPESDDCI